MYVSGSKALLCALPCQPDSAACARAGCIAWLSIYPLDVIKSRMQGAAGSSATRGKTWLHYARDIWSEGGMRGMWRGIGPTLARAFVMDAVSFLGYTNVLRLLREP